MNNSLIFLGTGKCSTFGGGQDNGVGIHEGLAVVDQSDLADWYFSRLFEPANLWKKAFGLARNLNPDAFYCAMRWSYSSFNGLSGEILPRTTREQIRRMIFLVTANGITVPCQAADWGPNETTGRFIDLAPGAARVIKVKTDDTVLVSALIPGGVL